MPINDVIKIEISANTVAWYGAILATVGFILGLLNYLRDNAKIKVEVSEGWLTLGDSLSDDQIIIKAINTGRRTITLNNVGFILRGGGSIIIPHPENITFPYELREGKSVLVYTDKMSLLNELKNKKKEIKYAWFIDATGKIYKTKFEIKKE